jgi:hypothetical protein
MDGVAGIMNNCRGEARFAPTENQNHAQIFNRKRGKVNQKKPRVSVYYFFDAGGFSVAFAFCRQF